MRPTCSQCRTAVAEYKTITVIKDNQLHHFCSKKCKDKWVCIIDPDNCLRFF